MRVKYRVARTKAGRFIVIWYDERGGRHRSALNSPNKWTAQSDAADFIALLERKKPKHTLSVGDIVRAYLENTGAIGKPVMEYHWKAAREAFDTLTPMQITEELCKRPT